MSDPGAEATVSSVGAVQPAGNASRDDWFAYATSQGATTESLEGMTRNDIRDEFSE